MKNAYLKRFGIRDKLIDEPPEDGLNTVVVIPSHAEPGLAKAVDSLAKCDLPERPVEVIIVINHAVDAGDEIVKANERSRQEVVQYIRDHGVPFPVHIIYEGNLPVKHAGVGLARKIGMDEAVRRLDSSGNSQGVIVCFDADCTCSENYLVEIERFFNRHPKATGCNIHFEHPVSGNEHSEATYRGIVQYELHLRYYKQAWQFAGHPYAYHTIGSSMAVRSKYYQQEGGMNKRKAGEDFYFLQKVIPLGNFGEIHHATVFPSPRASFRVPFGTGRAIGNYLNRPGTKMYTYDFGIFRDLQDFLRRKDELYAVAESGVRCKQLIEEFPEPVKAFAQESALAHKLVQLRSNVSQKPVFLKRFFEVVNAFWVLKYVHFATEHYFPKVSVKRAVQDLVKEQYDKDAGDWPLNLQLDFLRERGKQKRPETLY